MVCFLQAGVLCSIREQPFAILAIFLRIKAFLMYFHRPKLQGGVPKLTKMRYAQLPGDKSGDLEWSTIFGLCRRVPSECPSQYLACKAGQG